MIIQRMSSKTIVPSMSLLLERKCNNTIMADPNSQMPKVKKALPIFTASFYNMHSLESTKRKFSHAIISLVL